MINKSQDASDDEARRGDLMEKAASARYRGVKPTGMCHACANQTRKERQAAA